METTSVPEIMKSLLIKEEVPFYLINKKGV